MSDTIAIYPGSVVLSADEARMVREALEALSIAAQATGGVAGRDEGLVSAIAQSYAAIALLAISSFTAKGA